MTNEGPAATSPACNDRVQNRVGLIPFHIIIEEL